MDTVTEKVKAFYEEFPYPGRGKMSRKALRNYAEWFLPAIGEESGEFLEGKKALEAGCGTGELSCGMALFGADVTGIDISAKSVEFAERKKSRLKLGNAKFINSGIMMFSPKEKFDLCVSLGVLHHTPDPREGFEKICSLVKPGGIVCIGLYNRYGRAKQRAEIAAVKTLGGGSTKRRLKVAKKLFGKRHESRNALADSFAHPFESHHSVREVLEWFAENNVAFLGCKPPLGRSIFLSEFSWLVGREGAFFIMGGKKLG